MEMIKPGGLIVFCLCSLEQEEGPALVKALQKDCKVLTHIPITTEEIGGYKKFISNTGDLRILPCHLSEKGGMDGFFATRFKRL